MLDIDECSLATTCSQGCHNKPGGYQCFCMDGYREDSEGHCRAASGGRTVVMFAHHTDIKGIDVGLRKTESVVEGTKSATALVNRQFVFPPPNAQ